MEARGVHRHSTDSGVNSIDAETRKIFANGTGTHRRQEPESFNFEKIIKTLEAARAAGQ